MKRQIITWGMMLAAAFTLTNCAKEIENPTQEPESVGYPFEIVASTVDTKTVNDGMSTKWVTGDQINLFHAVGESTTYVSDGAFTVSDVEAGRFTGTLNGELDSQEEYDWFAFYPYTSQITTPANNTTYVTVGSKTSSVQTQNGNNSTAHIAGLNYPIVGKAQATPATSTPTIDMYHATSLIKVVVTNNTDQPLKVEEIYFVAPEHVVGTYYIDFTTEKLTSASFKSSGDSYTSNTARLAVTDGEALAKGESAEFYLAVKPFTASAGSSLELYVNGAVKELELTKDVTFNAGKIKTLNYSYVATEVAGPQTLTVAEFLAKEVNAAVWYQLTGTVKNIVNTEYGNFDLVDETGSVYVYGLTTDKQASNNKSFNQLGLKEGDVLTLMGTRAVFNSTAQVGGPAYYVSHKTACTTPVISVKDNVVTIEAAEGESVYYTTTGDEPTTSSALYEGPFEITETVTVKAIAVAEGKVQSLVAERECAYVDPNATKPTTITDVLTANLFKATNTTYVAFSDVIVSSDAVYAGKSAKTADGGIQLRSSKSEDGIVSITSGGNIKKVVVEWESTTTSGRTLDIYGSKNAYANATDLYNDAKKGTKLGSIVYGTSTELEISGDYQYVGLRSNNGAMYLTSIAVTWSSSAEGGDEPGTPVMLDTPSVTCSVNDITETSLKFMWDAVTNASKYVVSFNDGAPIETDNTYYEATDLTPNSTYSISVKALGDGVNYTTSAAGTAEGTTKESEQPGGGDEGEEPEQPSVVEKTIAFKLDKTTTGNTSTKYVESSTTFTYDGVSYSVNNWNPSTIQVRGNQTTQSNLQSGKNFMLRNTTAIPGKIKSITITYTEGTIVATNTYVEVGSSAITNQTKENSKTGTAGTNSVTWTFADGGSYFALGMAKGATSGTTKAGTITIVYEAN